MSSILEALERAEQERNLGEKKLFLATAVSPPSWFKKNRHFWWLGGTLLLLNLIIWRLLVPGNETSDADVIAPTQSPPDDASELIADEPQLPAENVTVITQRAKPLETTPQETPDAPLPATNETVITQQAKPAQTVLPEPKPQPEPQEESSRPAELEATQPQKVTVEVPVKPLELEARMPKKTPVRVTSVEPKTVSEPATVAKVDPVVDVVPATRDDPPATETVSVSKPLALETAGSTLPSPQTPAATPEQETVVATIEPAVKAEPPPVVETQDEEAELAKIPLVWELSSSIQRKLAKLKVNIHVYNQDAAKRFVIINMKRYREGDSLRSGMRLEQITPKGVVIDYGNGLVRM